MAGFFKHLLKPLRHSYTVPINRRLIGNPIPLFIIEGFSCERLNHTQPLPKKSCKGKPARLYGRGGYETPTPLRAWRLRNPRAPSGVAVTKPSRPFGGDGYGTHAPRRGRRLQNPRAPSREAVTEPGACSGVAVTKPTRPVSEGGYKIHAPRRARRLRNPRACSGVAVTKSPRLSSRYLVPKNRYSKTHQNEFPGPKNTESSVPGARS